MKNSFTNFFSMDLLLFYFFVMFFSFLFTNKKLTKDLSSNVSGVISKVDSVVSIPFVALTKSHNVISDLLSTYSENRDLKSPYPHFRINLQSFPIYKKKMIL